MRQMTSFLSRLQTQSGWSSPGKLEERVEEEEIVECGVEGKEDDEASLPYLGRRWGVTEPEVAPGVCGGDDTPVPLR